MDFNSNSTKRIYSNREVSDWWLNWAEKTINPKDKVVADIGCGGGIYSKGFYQLGASVVIMVDSSEKYIEEVRQNLSLYSPIIKRNECTDLEIDDGSINIVFERALIHHLSKDQMLRNLIEVKRILKSGGYAFIQDRVFQDIINKDERYWIRNTLFECFPRLLEYEQTRRPDCSSYQRLIEQSGLRTCKLEKIPEVRVEYSSIDDLCTEILKRKGKSILFELSDSELDRYCQKLRNIVVEEPFVEQDVWTVWILQKS